MRQKSKYLITTISVIGILALAWFWLAPSKAVNFVLPDINELSYINAMIESDTAHFEIIGVIENKAPYSIHIDSIDYEFELAGELLICEHQKVDVKQSSGEKDTIVLAFRLPISKTRSLIQALQNRDSTKITANIDVTYNTVFGNTSIHLSKDFDVKVPTPPEFNLNKVKAGELNLKQKNIDIALDVSIKNNSEKIELCLQNLNYDATIGNNISGKGKIGRMIVIPPQSTENIVLPINVKIDKPFEVFWKVITDEDLMNYEINLRGMLVNDTIKPIPLSVTINGKTQLLK